MPSTPKPLHFWWDTPLKKSWAQSMTKIILNPIFYFNHLWDICPDDLGPLQLDALFNCPFNYPFNHPVKADVAHSRSLPLVSSPYGMDRTRLMFFCFRDYEICRYVFFSVVLNWLLHRIPTKKQMTESRMTTTLSFFMVRAPVLRTNFRGCLFFYCCNWAIVKRANLADHRPPIFCILSSHKFPDKMYVVHYDSRVCQVPWTILSFDILSLLFVFKNRILGKAVSQERNFFIPTTWSWYPNTSPV